MNPNGAASGAVPQGGGTQSSQAGPNDSAGLLSSRSNPPANSPSTVLGPSAPNPINRDGAASRTDPVVDRLGMVGPSPEASPPAQGPLPSTKNAPNPMALHPDDYRIPPTRADLGRVVEATMEPPGDSAVEDVGGIIDRIMAGDSPRESDQLAESLPLDLAKLDQAIQHYLDQIDGVSDILADLMAGMARTLG